MYESIQSTFFLKKKKKRKDIWCKRNDQVLLQSPEIMKFCRNECKKPATSYEKKETVTLSKIHKVKEKRGFLRTEDQINTAYKK